MPASKSAALNTALLFAKSSEKLAGRFFYSIFIHYSILYRTSKKVIAASSRFITIICCANFLYASVAHDFYADDFYRQYPRVRLNWNNSAMQFVMHTAFALAAHHFSVNLF